MKDSKEDLTNGKTIYKKLYNAGYSIINTLALPRIKSKHNTIPIKMPMHFVLFCFPVHIEKLTSKNSKKKKQQQQQRKKNLEKRKVVRGV